METLNNYLSYIYNLRKSRFIKDVSIVAGGTSIAQAITMAFSPIITRLYGPEAFGILGIFNSLVTIIVPVSSLAYLHAIVLPASDEDAKSLIKLSFCITAGIFIVLVFIIFPFNQHIAHKMGFGATTSYLLLVPLVVVLASIERILRQWLIRKKQFKSISGISVVQAAATGILKSGIGYFYPIANVLIIINVISHFLHAFLLWFQAAPTLTKSIKENTIDCTGQRDSLKKVANTYRDFPFFRSPQDFINAISQNLPTIILAALFGPIPAGFYSLSKRVLTLPSLLISKSVGTVFLPRMAEAANRGEVLRPYILKTTGVLALIGLLPFGIVIAFGPWLFNFVFGSEWITSGEYAKWLSVLLYFGFISGPSGTAIVVLKLQKQLLIYETLSTATKVTALLVGAVLLKNDIIAIAVFSIGGAIFYIGLIVWTILYSNKKS